GVLPQLAVQQHLPARREDPGGRREEARIDDLHARAQLPQDQQQDRRRDREDEVARGEATVAGALRARGHERALLAVVGRRRGAGGGGCLAAAPAASSAVRAPSRSRSQMRARGAEYSGSRAISKERGRSKGTVMSSRRVPGRPDITITRSERMIA